MKCSVDGCGREAQVQKSQLCNRHRLRLAKYGDPLGGGVHHGEPQEWLLAHVNHSGEDCLIWPFAKKDDGYAHMSGGERAHRVMCRLAHGAPPSQLYIAAHSCGNGHLGCIHPGHLRWATKKDNQADRILHGTSSRGENSPHAKLTTADVLSIRRRIGQGDMGKVIAADFGISQQELSGIKHGRSWGWLT